MRNMTTGQVERILNYRLALWHHKIPFTIGWCQKSGCTFTVRWFFWQLGLLEEAERFHPWVHIYENEMFYRTPNYFLTAVELVRQGQRPHVKIMRNPYRRAVSSYLIFATQPRDQRHWSVPVYARFLRSLHGSETCAPGISFRDFLKEIAVRDCYDVDPHFAPQVQPGEQLAVDRVVFLETAEKQLRALEEEYGLAAAPFERLRQSGHHNLQGRESADRSTPLSATRLSFGCFEAGGVPAYEEFLDAEARALVEFTYRGDLEFAAKNGIDYRPATE